MKYQLMVDPTPAGWAYGFPKALPEEAVLCGGKEYDLYVNPKFDLSKWIVEEGYPEESLAYYRLYPQEVEDVLDVYNDDRLSTNQDKDFVYPGSDPQE